MTKILNENKNTKVEFVSAYKEQLSQIESLKSALANPQEVVAQKKSVETIAIANKVAKGDIASVVEALQIEVSGILESLVSNVTNGSQELVSLQEAIDLKKAEIKQLFDIETTSYSLTALLNTEKTLKVEFDVTKKERTSELSIAINDLNSEINNLKNTLNDKLTEINGEVQVAKKKALSEWSYELNRKKQVDNDNWDDEKKVRERELADLEATVDKRESNVIAKEEEVAEYEKIIESIPELIRVAEEKSKKAGKEETEKSFVFERRSIEAKAKTEVTILENKVEMLVASVERQNKENEQLKADLKAAYGQVQSTATAAVEAQANANARMVSGIETASRDSSKITR